MLVVVEDDLARRHSVGLWSFNLMLVHVVVITVGYAAVTHRGLWGTIVDFIVNHPGMFLAVALQHASSGRLR
jgi:hypothetical protein